MSWGPGREGQTRAELHCRELTCPAPALHPHPAGLGARGPLDPRSPDTFEALALLCRCLKRVSGQHLLIQAELREGQKQQQQQIQPGPACPVLHHSPLYCPRAREERTGHKNYTAIWAGIWVGIWVWRVLSASLAATLSSNSRSCSRGAGGTPSESTLLGRGQEALPARGGRGSVFQLRCVT